MVECEYFQTAGLSRVDTVLIDTWWNVNVEETTVTQESDNVLIDTWWNVNINHKSYITGVRTF